MAGIVLLRPESSRGYKWHTINTKNVKDWHATGFIGPFSFPLYTAPLMHIAESFNCNIHNVRR